MLKRYAYAYDLAANRTTEQIDDAITVSTYDVLNRLVGQQAGGALRVAGTINEPATVTIDGRPATVASDNRFEGTATTQAGTNTFTVIATDGSGNSGTQRYAVNVTGASKTFTYDANGNMLSDGTRTFEWDAKNRLVAVTAAQHRSEFAYDGQNRRIAIVERENGVVVRDARYIWRGTEIAEERVIAPATVTQFFEYGERHGTEAYFTATDFLGSVRVASDASAIVKSRFDYDPFGRQIAIQSDVDVLRAFTGHEMHYESGLILTLFRAYSPEYGRWLSPDPLGTSVSTNLYAYVENEPTRLVDPFGLQSVNDFQNCSEQQKGQSKEAFKDICKQVAKNGRCRQVLEQYGWLTSFERQCRNGIRVRCEAIESCGGFPPAGREDAFITVTEFGFSGGMTCGGRQNPSEGPRQTIAHEMTHAAGNPPDSARKTYRPHFENWKRGEEVAYACRGPQ